MATTFDTAPAAVPQPALARRPRLGWGQLANISVGFFGIQIGFALQNANMSRIFQSLGTAIDDLPALWVAAPLTGLLVQPIIGHMSDRTWLGRLGRRRPYFLAGAILAAISLFVMPLAPALLFAAVMLWVLDASLNISMEPFRAFVGDMLDPVGTAETALGVNPAELSVDEADALLFLMRIPGGLGRPRMMIAELDMVVRKLHDRLHACPA